MEFQNQSALITGASSGLGAEFARQLQAGGANVILVARRMDKMNELAAELNAIRLQSAEVLAADLTNLQELKKVTDYIKNNKIDILINNAGFGSLGYFDEIDLQHETKMVSLNITSTLATVHAVIPQMKRRKSGAIISLSSIAAFFPMPLMATYAATKSFNFRHTMALRSELSEFNIRVLTVCPGPTETDFFGAAHLSGMAKSMNRDKVEDVVRESLNALRKKRAYVITGIKAKLMYIISCLLPYFLSSWLIKLILKPKNRPK
jgi:short-subunit dehydrogenase